MCSIFQNRLLPGHLPNICIYYFSLSNAQEERQRTKERSGESEVESTSTTPMDMPMERIMEAERRCELRERPIVDTEVGVTIIVILLCCLSVSHFNFAVTFSDARNE